VFQPKWLFGHLVTLDEASKIAMIFFDSLFGSRKFNELQDKVILLHIIFLDQNLCEYF
jgi:hypothetical protein